MITGQGGINDIPLLLFSENISYYIYLIHYIYLMIFPCSYFQKVFLIIFI